jgi:nucleotide-binding universal stress UspA family protein
MSWLPKKTVVTPVDFSEFSSQGLDAARAMIEQPADLHVIHVLPELSPLQPGVIWGTIDDDSRVEHATDALREFLQEHGLSGCTVKIAFGDPAHEIASYAEEIGADLITIPSHGRTGPSRFLIGSVAERVVRFAHCPVLVLRSA